MDPQTQGGLPGITGSAVGDLLIVIALLLVAVKIPGLGRNAVMHGAGEGGSGSRTIRVVVVQQGMRFLAHGLPTGARTHVRRGATTVGVRR